ncbi:helix-turn-helix domain-containing protein [Fodinicola acaciae]|uniref:helix-turn-helix domain-containing protein n=1 Tax=Fodinicola acaciae TaxID=2681555 RepID=UPI0013D576EC|nr:helix-turn-helix domain-containing protein [Fodinicola acaciae]
MTGTFSTSVDLTGPLSVQVSINPLVSAFSLVADSIGGRSQGTPEAVRSTVRSAVSHPDVLRPLFARESSAVPDCLVPFGRPGNAAMADQLAELRAVSASNLVGEIDQTYDGRPPACWRPVLSQPHRWLDAYATALTEAWTATQRLWSRARSLLAAETDRIGAAVVTDAVDVLLSSLSSRFRYSDGRLLLPDAFPVATGTAGRPLVLVPVVSGIGANTFNLDRPDLVWIGYPVPGIGNLWEREPPAACGSDPLRILIGPVRATLLRGLSAPMSMSDAAALAACSATTMTHHCQYLERAGLIYRHRRQRTVMIHRSVRGDNLVDLFATAC